MLSKRVHKKLTWIELVSPTQEELRLVMREFDIHPLVVDELSTPSSRQKAERYGDFVYLVLNFPSLSGKSEEQEIDLVVGKHVFITVCYEMHEPMRELARSFETAIALQNDSLIEHGGHMLFLLLRRFYKAVSDEVEGLHDQIRCIEESVFLGQERKMVYELSHVGRTVLDWRRTLIPHQEALRSLEAVGTRLFGADFAFYAKLIDGDYLRAKSNIDSVHDTIQELRETNNSLLSIKQGEASRTLAAMGFLTFPLMVVLGVFTIETRGRPIVGATPYDFWIIVGILVAVAIVFGLYFKYKEWW